VTKTKPKEILLQGKPEKQQRATEQTIHSKTFSDFFFFFSDLDMALQALGNGTHSLPFLKGMYLELAPPQGDSGYLQAARTAQLRSLLDRSPPVNCKVLSQLDKGQKPESPCLDPTSSIPSSSSSSSLQKICSWRRGAKGNNPRKRSLWRRPAMTKDYCNKGAEDN